MSVLTFDTNNSDENKRLDMVVFKRINDKSRSFSARLIKTGQVLVNKKNKKSGYRVKTGDIVTIKMPEPESASILPEPIPFEILFEDNDIIIINKPNGLVVHPGPGHPSGTLINALLFHYPDIKDAGDRHGIVHRLDQHTSGCLVIAKNNETHQILSHFFKTRKIFKEYLALVYGRMESRSGKINLPIGRHPVKRKQMFVSQNGRKAETHWQVKKEFQEITLLELILKTGRTHQIRVHCKAIHHPIVGDPVYGKNKKLQGLSRELRPVVKSIKRQMLHSSRLGFKHPKTNKDMIFKAALPEDMRMLVDILTA
ncbi:Uncharacterized RNA pseudouridine synthase YlyB [Candidatus Magnetomoraceae bacterium gMMP-1]